MHSSSFSPLIGYEDCEVSTQIILAELFSRNYTIKRLSKKHNYFKVLKNNKEVFELINGTITSGSKLISYWKNENKDLANEILSCHGFAVPTYISTTDSNWHKIKRNELINFNYPVVVKPTYGSFGQSVHLNIQSIEEVDMLLEKCFLFYNHMMIQEQVFGSDLRFLVADNKVVAITKKEKANVIGDGTHSINDLISLKNRDRGIDNTKPLIKIKKSDLLFELLNQHGYNVDSVPNKGVKIFLGNVGNISQSGDSIDCTDLIEESIKRNIERACKLFDNSVLGVDVILNEEGRFNIIEVNEGPMLSMHNYPFWGKNRNVGKPVLDALLSNQ